MIFYFAWVAADEAFDQNVHCRYDEEIFAINILEEEGLIPYAQITIKHKRLGLVKESFAIISAKHKDRIYPVFKGRLVNCPIDIKQHTVVLEFLAITEKKEHLYQNLLIQLKENEKWNELFSNNYHTDQPAIEDMLDNREELLYWHRYEDKLGLSNIFYGSKEIDISKHFLPKSLKIKILHSPLNNITVNLVANWLQYYDGASNLDHIFHSHFHNQVIQTYTGNNLLENWWKIENNYNNGYQILQSDLTEISSSLEEKKITISRFDNMCDEYNSLSHSTKTISLKKRSFRPYLKLGWEYIQPRSETVNFTLQSGVQDFQYSPSKTKVLNIKLYSVDDIVDSQSFTQKKGSFFITDEGKKCVDRAMDIAKAYLAFSSRCVEISFCCPWDVAIALDCDSTIKIRDKRIPGGCVVGKIKKINFKANNGINLAYITIASAIGSDRQQYFFEGNRYAEDNAFGNDYSLGDKLLSTQAGVRYLDYRSCEDKEYVMYPERLLASDIVEDINLQYHADEQEEYIDSVSCNGIVNNLPKVMQQCKTRVKISLKKIHSRSLLKDQINISVPEKYYPPKQIELLNNG